MEVGVVETDRSMRGIDAVTLDEILADACFVNYEHHRRESAHSCCQQCGDEHDEENPPSYDVPRCKHGTQTCTNERHF